MGLDREREERSGGGWRWRDTVCVCKGHSRIRATVRSLTLYVNFENLIKTTRKTTDCDSSHDFKEKCFIAFLELPLGDGLVCELFLEILKDA